ncbi:pyridoxine-5'-phosphate oxidase-like isoform X1 [Argonauta hians]
MIQNVTSVFGLHHNLLSPSIRIYVFHVPSKWFRVNDRCYFTFYVPQVTPNLSLAIGGNSNNHNNSNRIITSGLNTSGVKYSKKVSWRVFSTHHIISFHHKFNISCINRSQILNRKLYQFYQNFLTVQKKMLMERNDEDQKAIQSMRKPYRSVEEVFDLSELVSKNPMKQFQAWFQEAKSHPQIIEANAIALATASLSGRPSVRMLLLKGITSEGFYFYSNFESRKAKEMEENPFCSFCVYWEPLNRSVRVEGKVIKIPDQESEDYFHSRPRDSQLGAVTSSQSTVIPSREYLMNNYVETQKKYEGVELIPKPKYWGGYFVKPEVMEFWQGQTNRLHDRLRFRQKLPDEVINSEISHEGEYNWIIERLSP